MLNINRFEWRNGDRLICFLFFSNPFNSLQQILEVKFSCYLANIRRANYFSRNSTSSYKISLISIMFIQFNWLARRTRDCKLPSHANTSLINYCSAPNGKVKIIFWMVFYLTLAISLSNSNYFYTLSTIEKCGESLLYCILAWSYIKPIILSSS